VLFLLKSSWGKTGRTGTRSCDSISEGVYMFTRIFIAVSLLALVGYGGLYVGQNQSKTDHEAAMSMSYDRGYEAGQKYAESFPATSNMVSQEDYNALLKDYNDLVNEANAKLNSAYQTRQPITCNSYDYGMNSTSTTCY
jgi:hypothetical protein